MDDDRAPGRLTVVGGPMFAGKTTALMDHVRRARLAGHDVVVVTHRLDTRHGAGHVVSHAGIGLSAHVADDGPGVLALVAPGTRVVAIDEGQFFGPGLVDAVRRLLDDGHDVVVAGLTVTFDGRPFEPLPALMAQAEEVVKLTARCAVCGRGAAFHVRLPADATAAPRVDQDRSDALVPVSAHVGGAETYEARCRAHRAAGV